MDTQIVEGVELRRAKHGGFVVLPAVMPGFAGGVLFAGNLRDCLAYIEATFNPPRLVQDGSLTPVDLEALMAWRLPGGVFGVAGDGKLGVEVSHPGVNLGGLARSPLDPEERRRESEAEVTDAVQEDLQETVPLMLTAGEKLDLKRDISQLADGKLQGVWIGRAHASWLRDKIDQADDAPAPWTTEIWRALSTAITAGKGAGIAFDPGALPIAAPSVIVWTTKESTTFKGDRMLHEATMWLAKNAKPLLYTKKDTDQ